MNKNKLYTFVKALSVIGLALSVYLLWQQFFTPAFQPCYVNSFVNCDAVISGPVAKTFGISTPLYGFIGYIVILFAAFTHRKKLLLSTATFGLIFCLWLAYVELVQLKVICPVCISCQIVMISIFAIGVKLNLIKETNEEK